MKRILPAGYFSFTPSLNQIDFTALGYFTASNLLAVIDVTTGKLVYSTAGSTSGYGGSFSGAILTYTSSNAGQSPTDILQVIYDDPYYAQNITGSITGTVVIDPSTNVKSRVYDGTGGYPILSTTDPVTGREGLDMNLQSSSFGGQIGSVLNTPYQDNALSIGFLNGGVLQTPNMDAMTNNLKVDVDNITLPTPLQVDLQTVLGNPVSNTNPVPSSLANPITGGSADFNKAATTFDTLRVAANIYNEGSVLDYNAGSSSGNTIRTASNLYFNGTNPALGAGSTSSNTLQTAANLYINGGVPVSAGTGAIDTGSIRTVLAETVVTGAAAQTTGNNIISGTGVASDVQVYRSFMCQIVSTGTGGGFIFESSNDNTNWQSCPVYNTALVAPVPIVTAITPTASSIIYAGNFTGKFFRIRVSSTITGGSIQAFIKYSQTTYTPVVQAVTNTTGANLVTNATVSGSLTSVGSITTVSTVTTCSTVSSVTSANLAATTITDIASAAITTTQTSANITMVGIQCVSFQVAVSAVSGTSPTLDVVVQETMDSVNYYDIYHFPRITAIGQYQSPQMKLNGIGIRFVRTVGGTTPSFTNSVVRINRSVSADYYRNFLSRTIDPNTLNSTTATYYTEGCDQFQIVANMNSGGTAPVFKLQGSEDGTYWYDMATVTSVVSSATQAISNGQFIPKFVRGITSTAGTGSTLICLHIKARGA